MDEVLQARGGWGGESLANASPALRARVAAADFEYEREAARQREERAWLVEQKRQAAIAASVRQAEERGEVVTREQRVNGVGRTRSESVAYFSAVQDLEDAKAAARQRRRFEAFELAESNAWSGDVTPMSPEEQAEDQKLLARGRAIQSRKRELREATNAAVEEVHRRWVAPGGRR